MKANAVAVVTAAAALLLTGCGSVQIGRINADPSRYRNRTIQVRGTVTNSVGALGTGGYQLEDGSGKIYVISRSGVPSRGSRVVVKGTVQGGVQVLGTSLGTAIMETSHKVK
jgi:hypothetical protein